MVNNIMRPSSSSAYKNINPTHSSNAHDSSNEDSHPSRDVVTIPSETDKLNRPSHRKNRDLIKDMEAIIMSRQDDPFLQNLASRKERLEDETDDSDGKSLLTCRHLKKNDKASNPLNHEMLSLVDVHEHMIRSPPPTITSTSGGKPVFSFLTYQTDK